MIQAINVFKKYRYNGVEQLALQDVSLTIPTGKSVAIIGKSGSGKSTLMHILSGLDRPDWGKVILGNTAMQNLPKRKKDNIRNRYIGFVFQSFFLLPKESVWRNVALPLEISGMDLQERKAAAFKALGFVEMEDLAERRAFELSGGQKQRVCIARAVVNAPHYLFADEPTGNLDEKTGAQIEDLLFAVNEALGSTLVLVTHNLRLAKQCNEVVEIEDGKIIKAGKP